MQCYSTQVFGFMTYHCLISKTDAMLQYTGLWLHDLPLFDF